MERRNYYTVGKKNNSTKKKWQRTWGTGFERNLHSENFQKRPAYMVELKSLADKRAEYFQSVLGGVVGEMAMIKEICDWKRSGESKNS